MIGYTRKNAAVQKRNHIRLSPGDHTFTIVSNVVVILFTFICLYPFWYMLINSIISGVAAKRGVYFFPMPQDLYFETYISVLKKGEILRSSLVSAARVVVSTVGCTVFSAGFAYLMTRRQLPFRRIIYRFAIITMYVSGGLIPWYVMMKFYGLSNNFATYVVPYMISVWSVILIKTYMESIPAEVEESARIDGAGFIITFFRIMLPLSKPILATCALFTAVATWNMYFDNYLLVTNPKLQTLQMELYTYINQAEQISRTMRVMAQNGVTDPKFIESLRNNITIETVRNTTTIIAMIPIMAIYPFLQKYFAKGIMLGAVKG